MPYVVAFAGTSNLLDTSDGIACCSKCGSGSIQVSLASGSSRCCWNVSRRDLQRTIGCEMRLRRLEKQNDHSSSKCGYHKQQRCKQYLGTCTQTKHLD